MLIYCIEDDSSIRELVIYSLKNSDIEAIGFASGSDGLRALKNRKPDLLLLDVMIPDLDGLSIIKEIRADSKLKKLPVIMLTAKSSEYDKVMGLDLGADDYITKPFGMMELISRIKALIRRSTIDDELDVIYHKNLILDTKAHTVSVDNKPVDLTLKEYELLHLLLINIGIVLKRDVILQNIWGYDFDGETRTVDVHIRTLRSKLNLEEDLIETVRGVGYRIPN